MRKKRIKLRYRKERCILSDVLPYEVPITFSNRHLYCFLLDLRIEVVNGRLRWLEADEPTNQIVQLLFSLPDAPVARTSVEISVNGRMRQCIEYDLSKARAPIPYRYKICHNDDEFRDLSIPHPRSQAEVVDFYDRCKETLIYLCNRSSFSVRRPTHVARCVYHKDRTHYDDLARDETIIEQRDEEYENVRSFFVYEDYSNVYKFYESHRYHRCEKKYERLLKLDISKCFDTIYTHSINWAILGKDTVKENLDKSKKTFGGRFDSLMQRLNYNETNGIIIGPEFSRLFAEIILQSVDCQVELAVLSSGRRLRHKVDYEILRYVDDYFVFYNSEEDKGFIVQELQHILRDYGLYLNTRKSVTYERPIITEISRAKREIARLLEEKLRYELTEIDVKDGAQPRLQGQLHIDARNLIIEFKTVLTVCGVKYRDVLNYTLAIVEKKTGEILRRYAKADPGLRSDRQLTNGIKAILEFAFFIYSVSPRVNSTIKLCSVLRIACDFYRPRSQSRELRHSVYKAIYDDIRLVLRKNKGDTHTQVETLYLIITLCELGREYLLDEDTLGDLFGISCDEGNYSHRVRLNYFSLTVLLFYMGKRSRFARLRQYVERLALDRFKERRTVLGHDTETTMLLMDLLACPYVSDPTKEEALSLFGVEDGGMREGIIKVHQRRGRHMQWFTTWQGFDFGKELDRKKGFEVY